MDFLTPEQIAEQMSQMVNIETKVICDTLANLGEADKLLIGVLLMRLKENGTYLGNYALVIRNMRLEAESEIAKTEAKLQQQGK